jgi:hypothetical protein
MQPSGLNFAGFDFVHIAPNPGLSGLIGTDEGMLRLVEMFGGVLILGRVAAADVSATETQTKVHPGVAGLNAVLTDVRGSGSNLNIVQVRAFLRHRFLTPRESSF